MSVGASSLVRPLRVLHVIHSLSGGGAERQLKLLVAYADSSHCEMAVFFVKRNEAPTPWNCKLFESKSKARINIGSARYLTKAIKAFKPDLIHVWLPPVVTIPAMLLARIFGIPCVFSYRSAMSIRRFRQIPEYLCALVSAARIAANNDVRQCTAPYRYLYRVKRGVVIENGVDMGLLAGSHQGFAYRPDRLKILFAGRIVKEKNWRTLIDAVVLLPHTLDWHLTICGDGNQREELLTEITTSLASSRITWAGFQANLPERMRDADVFVLPSLYEGTSNALLEALAIGTPCVVSDIPSHRAIEANAACFRMFAPTSSRALADALADVVNNPEGTRKFSRAGLVLARRHSPRTMAQRYCDLYRSTALAN